MARPRVSMDGLIDDVIAGLNGMNAQRSTDLCEWGCRALMDYARADNEGNKLAILEKQGLDALKLVMTKHAAHEGVQFHSCLAIAHLSKCDAVLTECIRLELPQLIVEALRAQLNSERVTYASLWCIWSLSRDEELRASFGTHSVAALAVEAMKKHEMVEIVQRYGCAAVTLLAKGNEENLSQLSQAGVIEAIANAIQNHSQVDDVVQSGYEAIEGLCITNENRILAGQFGCTPSLLISIANPNCHPSVLQAACRAVARLAQYDKMRTDMLARGLMDAIVDAMNRNKASVDVQLYSCWALLELAAGDEDDGPNEGEIEVVDAILSAIRRHESVRDVIRYGAIALENLSQRSDTARISIAEQDGCKLLLSGARYHMESSDTLWAVLRALAAMAGNDPKMHEHITQIGGVGVTLKAMVAHKDAPQLQADACRLLSNLALHGRVRDILDNEGVLEAIIDAAKRFRGSADLQIYACSALEHLADDSSRRVTFADDASNISLTALNSHKDDEDVLISAMRLMLKASFTLNERVKPSPTAIRAVVDTLKAAAIELSTGAITTAAAAAPDVISGGLHCLAIFSENNDNRATIRESGAMESIVLILNKFRDIGDLQRFGCAIVANLSFKTGKEKIKVPCVSQPAIESTVNALRAHRASLPVTLAAANAIRNIVCHGEGRVLAVRLNVIEELFKTTDRFPFSEEIIYQVSASLNNIAKDRTSRALISLPSTKILRNAAREMFPETSNARVACDELFLRIATNMS